MGVSLLIVTHTFCISSPAELQKSQPLLHTCIRQERSAGNPQQHMENQQKINKIHRFPPSAGLGGASLCECVWFYAGETTKKRSLAVVSTAAEKNKLSHTGPHRHHRHGSWQLTVTPPSARPPVRPSASPPVRPSARPPEHACHRCRNY